MPLIAMRPKLLHLSWAWWSLADNSSVSKTGGKPVAHDIVLFVSSPIITTATDAFISGICKLCILITYAKRTRINN